MHLKQLGILQIQRFKSFVFLIFRKQRFVINHSADYKKQEALLKQRQNGQFSTIESRFARKNKRKICKFADESVLGISHFSSNALEIGLSQLTEKPVSIRAQDMNFPNETLSYSSVRFHFFHFDLASRSFILLLCLGLFRCRSL